MDKKTKLLITHERYELGDTINSKVLAFAFGLSAEIERNMSTQGQRKPWHEKKAGGTTLGRPKGSLSKTTKLTGKEDAIKELPTKKVAVSSIAKIMGVHRLTVANFIKNRKLKSV